ncbi:hypothetical protein Tco_0798123 [Tanacetum coccineum]
MTAEVPQTLEYKSGQLNVALLLEVGNFTNWKKRYMCHIVGIKPQFKNTILNGLYVPMTASVRKHKAQWTDTERKAANLDQHIKSLFIFKEGEDLTQTFTRYKALMIKLVNDGIKISKLEINIGFINGLPKKWLSFYQSLRNANHDFQDSPDDEEDTRSSQEYINDLELEFHKRDLLAKCKRFFKKDEEEVSSGDNKMVEIKVHMELADDESGVVGKESAKNGE